MNDFSFGAFSTFAGKRRRQKRCDWTLCRSHLQIACDTYTVNILLWSPDPIGAELVNVLHWTLSWWHFQITRELCSLAELYDFVSIYHHQTEFELNGILFCIDLCQSPCQIASGINIFFCLVALLFWAIRRFLFILNKSSNALIGIIWSIFCKVSAKIQNIEFQLIPNALLFAIFL